MARKAPTAPPSAQASIAALKAQGWSDARIGRAVGRDSSLIHQISAGKKPGNNLRDVLADMAKGKPPKAPAPRRMTKAGAAAHVRTSAKTAQTVKTFRGFLSMLERAAAQRGRVQIGATFQDFSRTYEGQTVKPVARVNGDQYRVNLFRPAQHKGGGEDAAKLLKQAQRYAAKHPDWSDRKLLEGFLKNKASFKNEGYRQTAKGFVSASFSTLPWSIV